MWSKQSQSSCPSLRVSPFTKTALSSSANKHLSPVGLFFVTFLLRFLRGFIWYLRPIIKQSFFIGSLENWVSSEKNCRSPKGTRPVLVPFPTENPFNGNGSSRSSPSSHVPAVSSNWSIDVPSYPPVVHQHAPRFTAGPTAAFAGPTVVSTGHGSLDVRESGPAWRDRISQYGFHTGRFDGTVVCRWILFAVVRLPRRRCLYFR